jgi:integrase
MASIRERKRGDGSIAYTVLYKIDGRQSSLTFDDEKQAAAFKAAVDIHGSGRALEMYGVDPAPRRHDRASQMTVAEWVRRHIDDLTGVEQYTLDTYERYLRLDIEPFFGQIPLTALRAEDIGRWVKQMETTPTTTTGRPLTPKTIKNKHGFLSGALAAAVLKGHLAANPAAGRRLPRVTGGQTGLEVEDDIRMLSRDEFTRLHSAMTEPWRPFVEFLVTSGCRWGEATALRPADVNRTAGTVRIRRAWKYSSKGYTIGQPKTKRSKRTINVPMNVLAKLDYSHEWLFTNRAGGPIRYQGFRRRVWDKAVARAQLDPAPTPHDLRHTCASWMLNAGVPITTVSRHLGHESIKITADIYGDVDRASHQAAADVMSKLLAD